MQTSIKVIFILCINLVCSFVREMDPHDTHVKEHPIMQIYSYEELDHHSKHVNVIERDGSVFLESKDHKGSLINFNENMDDNSDFFESNIPDSSLVFTISQPKLKDLQRSGIYFWFTESEISVGKFRGGSSKFTGVIAGIEFSENRAELIFTYNHDVDYEGKEKMTFHYDQINPERLRGVDDLTIKIIHTKNNFKFEIFDGEALISDNFKINEPRLFSDKIKLHKIACTTYYESPNSNTGIELHSMGVFKREEGEDYMNMDMHVEHNEFPRTEPQEELRHSIANLSHFISYLSAVFGTHGESTITQMLMSAKNLLKVQKVKVEQMLIASKIDESVDEEALRKENMEKMNQFDEKMKTIYNKMNLFKAQLEEFHNRQNHSTAKLGNMIIGFGIFIAGFSVFKMFIEKYNKRNKTIKNE